MRRTAIFLTAGLLALAGCGGDDDGDSGSPAASAPSDEAAMKKEEAAKKKEAAAMKKEQGAGTAIGLGDSEFGTMLFGRGDQAIYIFQNDPKGETVCYGECAEAWPPVFTEGKPKAGEGVRESLLGTVERRDGRLQVTYAGKPLYYYAHEAPGEVRCHNVNLNGGLWWVVGPDGERRA
jgi:predicted lipoprotein with Yx(FWY)xxD motif